MDVITVDRLTRNFAGIAAVDALSFSVAAGELFGLIGPDGAGKTTTLRMLAAILEPSGGEARVLGRHTVHEAEAIKPDIGYMSQRFGLYPDLTVLENLDFYADLYAMPVKGRAERVERLLAFSNLAPFRRRQAGNLSGGMKQKLGLACALIHTPRILFLDEPTNGVDPVSRRDFWRILYQLLQEGVTIVVTTAYLDEADRCHRVGLLHQGRLVACDTPARLRTLMPGVVLELHTRQSRLAARLLREQLPDVQVDLFGDRVHLVSAAPAAAEQAARQALQAAGIELLGLRPVEPSLEDVFIAVLGNPPAGGKR